MIQVVLVGVVAADVLDVKSVEFLGVLRRQDVDAGVLDAGLEVGVGGPRVLELRVGGYGPDLGAVRQGQAEGRVDGQGIHAGVVVGILLVAQVPAAVSRLVEPLGLGVLHPQVTALAHVDVGLNLKVVAVEGVLEAVARRHVAEIAFRLLDELSVELDPGEVGDRP